MGFADGAAGSAADREVMGSSEEQSAVADEVEEAVRAAARGEGMRAVVLDMETVPSTDVSAVRMLSELRDDLERDGGAWCWRRTSARSATSSGENSARVPSGDAYPSVAAAIAALTSQDEAAGDGAG